MVRHGSRSVRKVALSFSHTFPLSFFLFSDKKNFGDGVIEAWLQICRYLEVSFQCQDTEHTKSFL